VRRNFEWVDVPGVTLTPAYPCTADAGSFTTYTFNLPNTWGDGVRIIGQPGGTGYFTSIHQLGVYFQAEDSPHEPFTPFGPGLRFNKCPIRYRL